MVVVHQLGAAGEGAQGVMASAFNLPNDPWVRGEVGWKQIMIYNVMQAKFETCTRPIAERVLEAGPTVEFDPYFDLVLLHEVSHGLGPAYRKNGESVSKSLGKSYTSLEEAKADIGGLCLMLHMGGSCGLPAIPQERLLRNYIGGLFRSMRFGVHEAHGMANVVEFNWMKRRGVIAAKGGRFAIEARNIREAADSLLAELCRLQASASVAEAEAFLAEYGKPGEEITGTIAGLADIPVDIRAKYA
jgi:hypothetical protein